MQALYLAPERFVYSFAYIFRALSSMAERLFYTQKVGGPIPSVPTIIIYII